MSAPAYDLSASHVGPIPDRLADLRRKLAEKFPMPERKPSGTIALGWPALDGPEGGLRRGAMTELCSAVSGVGLFLHAVLETLCRENCFGAFIDAADTFDPGSYHPASMERLLWVRRIDATQAIKVVDLLLRDGNFTFLLLDLHGIPPEQLRRIPPSTWHRFQRLIESSPMAMTVFTPSPMVEAAQIRMALQHEMTLDAISTRRSDLLLAASISIIHGGKGVSSVRLRGNAESPSTQH